MTMLGPTEDRQVVGYVRQQGREGICVDPFDEGAHMCVEEAIQNVKRQGPDDPQMCVPCYERVMGTDAGS